MRLFGKKKVREIEAAGQFVLMVTKGIQEDLPQIADELTGILQLKDSISDDQDSGFEFLLAIIAAQIQALPNLLPSDQATRIREYVIQCISTPELGSYPGKVIQEYQTAWDQSLQQGEVPLYGIASVLFDKLECKSTVEIGSVRFKDPLLLMALSEKIVTFGGPWWKTLIQKYRLVP